MTTQGGFTRRHRGSVALGQAARIVGSVNDLMDELLAAEESGEDRRRRDKNGKARSSSMSTQERKRRTRSLLRRDGELCWICKLSFTHDDPPTLDHMIPRKYGGSDSLENLRLAHGLCNERRSNPPLGRRRVASDDDEVTS